MSKRNDEDDAIVIDAARCADRFMVSIFLGQGRGYYRAPVLTLVEARNLGALVEQRVANDRLSMVYAITPSGASIFVPRELDARIMDGVS